MRDVDLVASGYISFDRIVKIDRPAHVGRTSIVINQDSADIHFGGCSVNICYLLSKLGKQTLPIVRIGDDAEKQGFYQYLEKSGVRSEGVRHVPGTATSHAYLIEDMDGEHITLFHPGAMSGKHATPPDDAWFEKTKFATIIVGAPEDNLLVLEKVKRHNVPLIFGMRIDDVAFPVPVLKQIIAQTSYLFMNQSETEAVCKLYGIKEIQEMFALSSLKIIVTTLGSKGSVYHQVTHQGIKTDTIPAVPLDCVVDPAGAGDAYLAGFVYGLLEAKSVRICAEYGSTLASFILKAVGCTTNAPDLTSFLECHAKHYGGLR
ncbi:MAG: carbohydrate kinase family protein [Acholeplasmataceae bacterium]|nr:carbohydrate kinase family protein [Acholeplasmataceae bacterium]